MKSFALTPADAWFFRDGRPYNQKETNQADVFSLFPPPARTLSGALRAALARSNGWPGHGSWSPKLNAAFGPSPQDLGSLQFSGPFLIKDEQALWPLPRHLLGRVGETWEPVAFLHPDDKTCPTDAGNLNLPALKLPPGEKGDGLKPAEAAWVTSGALGSVLRGERPPATDIFFPGALWAHEPRVGLHRDPITLVVGEGALYSPAYVRLKKGVSLGVSIAGVPEGLSDAIPLHFPLGGESRLARSTPWPHDPLPPQPALENFKTDNSGHVRFTVILITPGAFREPPLPDARVVSACVGKPQMIGGWDSLRREPLPLQPFTPAGSVWFCTAPAATFPAIHAHHGRHLGEHSAHGFGQILIGHWPQPTNQRL